MHMILGNENIVIAKVKDSENLGCSELDRRASPRSE
jgi:hypothetical protein